MGQPGRRGGGEGVEGVRGGLGGGGCGEVINTSTLCWFQCQFFHHGCSIYN